ncbi:DNA-binding domain-containing protein [Chelatococcus sp. SYSU_G07232]|uniref:DNA-binding domain-containing protein n=1 Tax=Chelatococcus albus TaxID=3047466 RepID=A0ABT7AEY8_9HYPH|nr:DNA-binding domain-containing protein [Chelatococcus sp. SYSU_G07232]MDJ1157937.1 DNA-binding domain-containing protein [Chelatococcus sp. SYSU_G07232]
MAPTLSEIQAAFAAALVDPALPVPDGLCGPGGGPAARRFAVYRNNVVVGLTEALRARFPVTDRLVGPEFFGAMARAYVAAHKPASPLLMHYGDDLPDFIAAFEPAAIIVYLADVARLEAAWSQAYHAAEAVPIGIAALAAIPTDELASVHLTLHPSLRLLHSAHPVASIWAAHQTDGPVMPPEPWEPEDVLVVRPEAEVLVHRLPAGGLAFLAALEAGAPLGVAVERATAAAPAFDLPRNLAGAFEAGAVIAASISAAVQALAETCP